jgi:hypothetical protein
MKKARIFQLYYDEKSRSILDDGFIPLDNSKNPEQDWYEFSAIRNFLKNNALQDDTYYGFLSPKFRNKTGLTSAMLRSEIMKAPDDTTAILVSSKLRSLVAYWNVFLQGDAMHPGLLAAMQEFSRVAGLEVDLAKKASHTHNAVYSNFVIAKPVYWNAWLKLADRLHALTMSDDPGLSHELTQSAAYRKGQAAMKVFVQERIPALILDNMNKVYVPESFYMFSNTKAPDRYLYRLSDFLKRKYEIEERAIYVIGFYVLIRPRFFVEEKLREFARWSKRQARIVRQA